MNFSFARTLLDNTWGDIKNFGLAWAWNYRIYVFASVVLYFIIILTPYLTISSDSSLINLLALLVFSAFIFYLLFSAYLAVTWHRHIILSEPLDMENRLKLRDSLGYTWRLFLILAGVLLVYTLIGFVTGLINFSEANIETPNINIVSDIISTALFYLLLVPIVLYLPAYAIGKPITLGEAFRSIQQHWLSITLLFSAIHLTMFPFYYAQMLLPDMAILIPVKFLLILLETVAQLFVALLDVAIISRAYYLLKVENKT